MKNLKLAFLLLLAVSIWPLQLSNALSGSHEVELPISEIEDLIEQLEDAGMDLAGEAGNQMRDVIRELDDKLEQRIDQIRDASSEVLEEAKASLLEVADETKKHLEDLLQITNNMVANSIECIDEATALRIAQVFSGVEGTLESVEIILQESIDRIYLRADRLIETCSGRVAIVLNKTLLTVAKVAIIVICFIPLLILLRALINGKFTTNKVMRIVGPSLTALVVGAGIFLLASPTALASLVGEEFDIPDPDSYCEEGDQAYDDFFAAFNEGSRGSALESLGEEALEALSWCVISSASQERAEAKRRKKDEIVAILYPIPELPSLEDIELAQCDRDPGGGSGKPGYSLDPRWFDYYTIDKIKAGAKLYNDDKINDKPSHMSYSTFSTQLKTITLSEEAPKTVAKPNIYLYDRPVITSATLEEMRVQPIER